MKTKAIRSVINLLILLCIPLFLNAQEDNMKKMDQMSQEEMMNLYMEKIAPNEHHEWLSKFEGEWEVSMTGWWEGPDSEPQQTEGEAEYEMILGGRYLVQKTEMEWDDMEFEGIAYTAYDNTEEQYINSWIDNMGTGILVSKGQRRGDMLILIGTFTDPITNVDQTHRMTIRFEDEDKHVMEYFVSEPGKEEYMAMRSVYTRD